MSALKVALSSIFFKSDTKTPFCNIAEKLSCQNKPIKFTFILSQGLSIPFYCSAWYLLPLLPVATESNPVLTMSMASCVGKSELDPMCKISFYVNDHSNSCLAIEHIIDFSINNAKLNMGLKENCNCIEEN